MNTRYGNKVAMTTYKNEGYEPWSYAETLVDKWIAEGYPRAYEKTYPTAELVNQDITYPHDAYVIKTDWKSNTPTADWNRRIYARSMETIGFKKGEPSVLGRYGGATNAGFSGEATGFFHVEERDGRPFIIDPEGNPFFAVGMNTVQLGATDNQKRVALEKYGSEENFFKTVCAEMRDVGINTVWVGNPMIIAGYGHQVAAVGTGGISMYMKTLNLGVSTGGSAAFRFNNTMNVFDPDFEDYMKTRAAEVIAPLADEPRIVGWYSDNEIPAQQNMLECYLTIDPAEPVNAFSYAAAWSFLAARTNKAEPTLEDITPELSEEFKGFVYDRYFRVVKDAIRAVDQNHMYMGCRVHAWNKTSEGYLRAAGQYVDVMTVNLYGGLEPLATTLNCMVRFSGKPFLVTEFYAKSEGARDMNGYELRNQTNAGWIVKTQHDRAIHYENYILLMMECRACVGWTWYRFRDNDQTVYADEAGNLYTVYDYKKGAIWAYYNVATGDVVPAEEAPAMKVHYQGERDTSNLGSNKGIYDNFMNRYEVMDKMKEVNEQLFHLAEFFDKK